MNRPLSIYDGAVGSSIALRASLADEFIAKVAKQDERDAEIKTWLHAIASEEIREWIEDEGVIDTVYKYGRNNLGARFDFKDKNDAERIVRDLNKAWKGLIKATLTGPAEDLDIEFAAIIGAHG